MQKQPICSQHPVARIKLLAEYMLNDKGRGHGNYIGNPRNEQRYRSPEFTDLKARGSIYSEVLHENSELEHGEL
eukprot:4199599-Alexandrium_andersonii.AAC.1